MGYHTADMGGKDGARDSGQDEQGAGDGQGGKRVVGVVEAYV